MRSTDDSIAPPTVIAMEPLVRIFRVQTAHDAACAALVANTLAPGVDLLLMSTDKAYGPPVPQTAAIRSLASTHTWDAVVDVSGLPMGTHWLGRDGFRRLFRAPETRASVRECRRRLALPLGISPEDPKLASLLDAKIHEIYLNCLHHVDIQMLYRVAPSARKVYLPHGFDCLQEGEIHYYSPHLVATKPSERERIIDATKRTVLGVDSVPVRQVTLDHAITFNLDAPWVQTTHMGDYVSPEAMSRLFSALDPNVREYFTAARAKAGDGVGLLLLPPANLLPTERLGRELDIYAETATHLAANTAGTGLVVKPHPRASARWTNQIIEHVQRAGPALKLTALADHSAHPIEVVASVLDMAACAGFGSSSLRTLSRLYDIPAYCPQSAVDDQLQSSPRELAAWRAWSSADHGPNYVAI